VKGEYTVASRDLADEHKRRRDILGVVYGKWTVKVIVALSDGTRRHSELQRELGEVTPKALTGTLRQLEYDGLVQRTVYPVVPPKVEYSLTALGKTLFDELDSLCKWAQEHQPDVEGARERFKASTR
jgi:DNA-binding HxlR family transcriptional regulator